MKQILDKKEEYYELKGKINFEENIDKKIKDKIGQIKSVLEKK